MSDIQGIFVSEKVNRVRWLNEITESKTFITGSWDNKVNYVRTWQMNNDEPSEFEDETSSPGEIAKTICSYSIKGDVTALVLVGPTQVFIASSHGLAKLLTLPDLKVLIEWDHLHQFIDETPSPCTSASILDGDIVTVGEDGRMNFLTSSRKQVIRSIENADSCSIHCVCFLKHNEIITGNLRGQMKIWDLRSSSDNPSSTFLLSGEQVAATCIVNHPTQRHLVLAGSENGSLAVWDLRVNTYPASLLNAHNGAISEIQFHPDQPQRLFTCSAGGEIWHWDTAKMSKQITTTANALSVNESTINPWLMNDEDRSNLDVSSLMSDLHKPINSLDCNKQKIICGCDNEALYIINNVFI